MKEMKLDKARRDYTLIGVLGITVLALLMLVSIVDANPYAYITNSGSDTVSVIDTATNTVTATVNVGDGPTGVAFTPDGKKVYVANSDSGTNSNSGTVSVIDTATNTVTATVPVVRYPRGVAVAGTKVYVTSQDGSNNISIIDTATDTVTATVSLGFAPNGVAASSDGTKVYVTNYADVDDMEFLMGNVSVIDTVTDTVTARIKTGNIPYAVAVSPDGNKVYVTNLGSSNNVSVIDTDTNTVIASVPFVRGFGCLYALAVNPTGTNIYVTNNNNVSVIDAATNKVTAMVKVGSCPFGVSVTPDGKNVYVANCNDGTVSVIDTATNTVTATVSVGRGPRAFGQFIFSVPTLPVANFSTNVTVGYVPLSVQFADLSLNSTSRNWDFENNGNVDSTEETPVYVYTNPGTYTVNLTATNENGTDSKLTTITVLNTPLPPVASFRGNVTNGYAPLTVHFTDLSADATEWSWDFGDKTYSTDQNPVHTYNKYGKYTVKLTVKNSEGMDTEEKAKYISVSKLK